MSKSAYIMLNGRYPYFAQLHMSTMGTRKLFTKGDKPTTQPPGTNQSSSQASSSQVIIALTCTENLDLPSVPTFDSAPTTILGTLVLTYDGSCQLNCLIEGEYIVFSVTVGRDCMVGNLKEVIQTKRTLGTLKNVDHHTLELWKVNIDLKPHSEDSLRHLRLELDGEGVEQLASWNSIGEYWSDKPPTKHLHIIVKVPTVQENQTKRYRTGENPSTVCKDAKLMKSQQDYAEILNGRPWTSSGPPVGLYHPVFDSFLAYYAESTLGYKTASSPHPDDSTPSVDDAFRFMRASSEFYEVDMSGRVNESPPSGRVEALLPAFSCLLCVSLSRARNSDGTGPDARATAKTSAGDDGPLAVIEMGIGGDTKTQAQQSYARICSLPEHESVRLSSCSPCFLVEIAGPWITVFGAVYVQRVIVQRLAGPVYLPPQLLHPRSTTDIPLQLFCALRRALQDLCQYYECLPRQITLSRFFSFVRSYKLPSGVTMDLDYMTPLSLNDSKAIYLAKQADGREVVVKFPLTYNSHAHRLLVRHGLAPEFIYDWTGNEEPPYGGLPMIVMIYVEGRTLDNFLHSSPHQNRLDVVITSVKKAIALLHDENLVFGDLRTPNILVDDDDDDGVKLIDYDWCGIHQVDRYPFIIGDAIEWASGVGPLAVMHKDHDFYMLQRLEAKIRAGASLGTWS